MWFIRESQYPGLRLRHTQICVVLALCWNVVLACFGTFPVLFPVTEEAFEPMFGQQVYQLSYARLCNTLQDISIRHPGRESWSGTQPQSSSQAPPPIETQVEAPGDAPRRPQMVPLAPVTTCKNSRLSQSLKTCTYIYTYMSNIFQSEVSTKRIRQCWCQESNELFEHMPHLESPWAKGGRPCRPVGQGQVRSSQGQVNLQVNLQVNAQENQKHFMWSLFAEAKASVPNWSMPLPVLGSWQHWQPKLTFSIVIAWSWLCKSRKFDKWMYWTKRIT